MLITKVFVTCLNFELVLILDTSLISSQGPSHRHPDKPDRVASVERHPPKLVAQAWH